MSTRIKVEMKPVNTILTRLGVNKTGDVQSFVTSTINRRITRYMPYRTGVLSAKSKYIKDPTEIEVAAPYARYQYYGKVMVGKVPKVATDKDLNYTRPVDGRGHGNPLAGPFWDKRLMAAEGRQIAAEVQEYVGRRKR